MNILKGIDRMKRLIGLVIVTLVLLAACGSNNDKKVTIGVASNDTKAWEKVKELAKKMILMWRLSTSPITIYRIKH